MYILGKNEGENNGRSNEGMSRLVWGQEGKEERRGKRGD